MAGLHYWWVIEGMAWTMLELQTGTEGSGSLLSWCTLFWYCYHKDMREYDLAKMGKEESGYWVYGFHWGFSFPHIKCPQIHWYILKIFLFVCFIFVFLAVRVAYVISAMCSSVEPSWIPWSEVYKQSQDSLNVPFGDNDALFHMYPFRFFCFWARGKKDKTPKWDS